MEVQNICGRERKGKNFVSKFSINNIVFKITGQDEVKGKKNVLPC